MGKKEQLLIIYPPDELKFRGPFNKPIISNMSLSNPTDQTILFKIKTTAPRQYCVRPNFGALEPNSDTEVQICLHAFEFNPNEKNKHKFMVQSFVVPEGATDFDALWKDVHPDKLMDSKLRCVFELPVKSPDTTKPASEEQTVKAGGGDEKPSDTQNDYARAATEVKHLREETSQLRQENLQLKEQVLRLRMTAEANQKEQPTSSSSPYQNPYSPPQLSQSQIPMLYIGVAIAMALFGLLFGKYVL